MSKQDPPYSKLPKLPAPSPETQRELDKIKKNSKKLLEGE